MPVPAYVMPEVEQLVFDVMLGCSRCVVGQWPQRLVHYWVGFVSNEPLARPSEWRATINFDRDQGPNYRYQPNEQELQTSLIGRKVGLIPHSGSCPNVQSDDDRDQGSCKDRRSHGRHFSVAETFRLAGGPLSDYI